MSILSTVLKASGRHDRPAFWMGLAVTIVASFVQIILLRAIGNNIYGFLLGLGLLCLVFYMAYCVYAKRLHDIGRSAWLFFGMISLTIILMIFVQLNFGGMEYFDTLMANSEKHDDAEWMRQQTEIYQQELANARPLADIIMWSPIVLLTLWLGLKPSTTQQD